MSFFLKSMARVSSIISLIRFKARGKLILERGVKVNAASSFEDHVKIYTNVKVLGSSVGAGTYIGWNSVLNRVKIGRFCSIAPFVEVIYGRHAVNEFVSSHPAFYSSSKQAGFSFVKKTQFVEHAYADVVAQRSVIIGNDVWIGYGVRLIEGISIGDGAIIAAGALVTKDVEPYCIYAGIPAKKIKERFDAETIASLLEVRWWDMDFEWLSRNAEFFDCPDKLIGKLHHQNREG